MLGQRAQQGGNGIVEDNDLVVVLHAQPSKGFAQSFAHQRTLNAGNVDLLIQVDNLAVVVAADAAGEGKAEADAVAFFGHGGNGLRQRVKEGVRRHGAGLSGNGLLVMPQKLRLLAGIDAQKRHAQVGAARVHHNDIPALLGQAVHGQVGGQHGQAALFAVHAFFHMVEKGFLHNLHFFPGLDKADFLQKFRYCFHSGCHSFVIV